MSNINKFGTSTTPLAGDVAAGRLSLSDWAETVATILGNSDEPVNDRIDKGLDTLKTNLIPKEISSPYNTFNWTNNDWNLQTLAWPQNPGYNMIKAFYDNTSGAGVTASFKTPEFEIPKLKNRGTMYLWISVSETASITFTLSIEGDKESLSNKTLDNSDSWYLLRIPNFPQSTSATDLDTASFSIESTWFTANDFTVNIAGAHLVDEENAGIKIFTTKRLFPKDMMVDTVTNSFDTIQDTASAVSANMYRGGNTVQMVGQLAASASFTFTLPNHFAPPAPMILENAECVANFFTDVDGDKVTITSSSTATKNYSFIWITTKPADLGNFLITS